MHLRVAVVSLLALLAARTATASPAANRCRELQTTTFDRLDPRVQAKFSGVRADDDVAGWARYVVSLRVDRAPHLVRAILGDCPGVVEILGAQPLDRRNLTSQVNLRVTSFAALSRVLQLPAVRYVSVTDPTLKKRLIELELD